MPQLCRKSGRWREWLDTKLQPTLGRKVGTRLEGDALSHSESSIQTLVDRSIVYQSFVYFI